MEIAIITLGLVVLAQLIERHLYAKDMNQKLSDSIKAIMSRNVGEFIAATKPQDPAGDSKSEPEEVELSELSDDEFDKAVGIKK